MAAVCARQGPHPLRLVNFLHSRVIGTPARVFSRSDAGGSSTLPEDLDLPLAAVALVALPVFVQAPLVRLTPALALLITVPLVAGAVLLERFGGSRWSALGALLVGFCGSWLGGCLFWGWFRSHPLCHLPLEGCLLPLALTGITSRWRLAGSFYLASLAGTAATDAGIAATGLMPFWPAVLNAQLPEASLLLRDAATVALSPLHLLILIALALLLLQACRMLWTRGPGGRIAAATLGATLGVDGLFLGAALLAPRFSGLI